MNKPAREPRSWRRRWDRLRQARVGGTPVGLIAAGVIAALFLLGLGVPWQPVHADFYGIADYFDYSWMLVLHDALATGKQFGKQIILPYGPTGFIAASVFDPRTYLILVAARLALAGVVMAALWAAARKYIRQPLVALVWLISIILLMAASADHFFPICAVLLLLNYFFVSERSASPVVLAMVAALALASLAKVNWLLQGVGVVGAISLDQVWRRRGRGGWIPALYGACLFVFYLATGQSLSSIGAFIWGWAQVAGGHVDAVSVPGPDIDVAMYLVIALLILVCVGDLHWRGLGRAHAVLPTLAVAGLLVLLYKHSFVRQDFAHATIGPMVALAIAIGYAPLLWQAAGGKIRQGLCIATLVLAGIVASSSLTGNSIPNQRNATLLDYAWRQVQGAGAGLVAAGHDLVDPSRLRRDWEADRAKTRADNPLSIGAVSGTVDVYPHRQDVLLAYGLDYAPRPASQSLIATAPALARLNAKFLLTPAAPQSILFDIESVDNNYPSALDGLSWPNLLTRYDIADYSGAFLILRRARVPREYRLTPVTTLTAHFDEFIDLPPLAGGPYWARFHLTRRTGGRIISAVYKPPLVGITVRTTIMPSGTEQLPFRFLPSLAEEGFLLSPLVADRAAFAKLASPGWQKELAPNHVESLKIVMGEGSYEPWFERDFRIELLRLEFPRVSTPK